MLKLNNVNVDRGVLNITVDNVQYAVIPGCETNMEFITKLNECTNVQSAVISPDDKIWISYDEGLDDDIICSKILDPQNGKYILIKNELTGK